MAEAFVLDVQARQKSGTNAAKQLRKKGLVPAVIYGHKEATASLAVPNDVLVKAIRHGVRIFDVTVAGAMQKALWRQWPNPPNRKSSDVSRARKKRKKRRSKRGIADCGSHFRDYVAYETGRRPWQSWQTLRRHSPQRRFRGGQYARGSARRRQLS